VSPHIDDIITMDLIRQCRTGERNSLNVLVRTCQSFVFSVAFRLLADEEEAKDATQDSFLRMVRHLDRFDHRVKFTTWLYTIATNICLDKLRARKAQARFVSRDQTERLEELSSGAPAVDDHQANKELAHIIGGMTAMLPEKQRLVFVLRDLEDLSVDEVCAITGLSRGSVKTNLHYARREIRSRLARHYQVLEGI
jgi:RNA polymerase sigma-70 factor, ECF subfamily